MARLVNLSACALLLVLACSSRAGAAVAPSRERLVSQRDRSLRRVRTLLKREQVRARLDAMGMDAAEIERRLERLDDTELEILADRLDGIAVGRSALGVVVAVLVIATLVLLVVWLAQRI
jgi:hypothetical protein